MKPSERLLQDQILQTGLSNRILLVEEAGVVSGRQMWELLQLAERQSARIVFSGDTRQIHSVEASDALHILEKESRLQSTELQQVQRQIARDYRKAVKELRIGGLAGSNPWAPCGKIESRASSDAAADHS